MNVKTYWLGLKETFEAKSKRERLLVVLLATVGVALLGSTLLIQPNLARAKSLNTSIVQQQRDIDTLTVQIASNEELLKQDPDAAKKAEAESLRARIRGVEEQLVRAEGAFVPPEKMSFVLDTLLQRHPGLRLVELKTLEPVGVLAQPGEKAESPAQGFNLFRHGVELRLEGSYGDLHSYLTQLEQSQQKLLWGNASLAVAEYPKAVLTLVVYTLNSDKTWLVL